MNIPDRKDHHTDFYAEDDRPRFSEMTELEQEDIIEEFHDKHPDDYRGYYEEAISQLPQGHDAVDLFNYIAKCILNKHPDQEFVE